ncbi:hypothetical protein AJ80_04718 [Polytolypa hystricis UAMH7299]|uniref:ARS-binding protein 2 n=1 Tax=Polytolypa hystricis (strain UAMH7299) TaxID=1447883 RepID=A0A2B7Y923_POLH7|nr:hypothetical protein AJ80_04718 [Polytolypa hystricis UAMH7299]
MDATFPALGVANPSGGGNLPENRLMVNQYGGYGATAGSPIQGVASAHSSQRSGLNQDQSPAFGRQHSGQNLQPTPENPTTRMLIPASTLSIASMSPPLSTLSRAARREEPGSAVEAPSLPSRDITDASIDGAYVNFILYCNPGVPVGTDTAELRRTFRVPPRSDGKSFSVFTLWQLIQKLDRKEIKTWTQLAMELGVEPPSVEKKQSTQKVQQYAVRLKRWMRAMHVDAFFEYCLGHDHSYFMQPQSLNDQSAENRNGVPREEDLALRALFPEWKPKKGRKRIDDKDAIDPRVAKKPNIDTHAENLASNLFGYNPHAFVSSEAEPQMPWSALDDAGRADPWPNSPALGAHWRNASPTPQYPHSAITPRYRDSQTPIPQEPQSAITPASADKMQNRRRRGPQLSSAWPGASTSTTGRLRGRPSAQRTTQNGPFATFPANPKDNNMPGTNHNQALAQNVPIEQHRQNNAPHSASTLASPFQQHQTRPTRLQLQVPQTMGAPVRLATPPVVLVNGQGDDMAVKDQHTPGSRSLASIDGHRELGSLNFNLSDVTQAFTKRVLQSRLVNRMTPLSVEEAQSIATTTVEQVKSQCLPGLPPTAVTIYCATCLGVGSDIGLASQPPGELVLKSLSSHSPPHPRGTPSLSGRDSYGSQVSTMSHYELSYDFFPSPGFYVTVAIQNDSSSREGERNYGRRESVASSSRRNGDAAADDLSFSDDDLLDEPASMAVWRQRYINLRKQTKKKDFALNKYKKRILEAVMTDDL